MSKEKLVYIGELCMYPQRLLPINLKAVFPGIRIVRHTPYSSNWVSSLFTIQEYKDYCDIENWHYYPFWFPINIRDISKYIYE